MKLIKQTKLVFQQGSSDKVYEVDLCEVGQNRYVVNFRYGRSGANLKEGAKTTGAVTLAEADKIFTSLVAEKTRKGYRNASAQAANLWGAQRSAPAVAPVSADDRKQAVLNRLADAGRAKQKNQKAWPLERVIWRAGELKISEAAPLLIQLIGSGDALRDYCIAWALGFCGDDQAIGPLSKLYQNAATPDMVRRISCEALLKLSDGHTRAEFQDGMINSLPQELSDLARQGSAEALAKGLADYFQSTEASRFTTLETLYLIDNENTRPVLLNLLRQAPLKPNVFKAIRHIFKAAEYRRDAEVFGVIAYRLEKSRANFTTWQGLDKERKYPAYVYLHTTDADNNPVHQYVQNARQEILTPESKLAYSSRTRVYLRKRVWRTLRRLARLGDTDYVKMAVGVLLAFSDEDAQPVREASYYSWRSRSTQKVQWDTFAGYWAFNHILYTNSPRYFLKRNSKAWRCRSAYQIGSPAPEVREEAFPHLWDERPQGLLHLLAESRCLQVLEFAVKSLTACEAFCAELDIDTVLMILERPYEITAQLGLKLAKQHYNALSPNRDLTLALANCASAAARREAQQWIQAAPASFLKDSAFLAALVFSAHADTREFAGNLLRSSVFSDAVAQTLVARLIAQLLTLDKAQAEEAREVADTILTSFANQLRSVGMNVILDLLDHPLLEVQELGGKILLHHDGEAKDLPEAIINSLIASPFESLRRIGIELFGQLDEETLLTRDGVIAAFAMHELEDIRNAIRPVIHRLCMPPVQPDPRADITYMPLPDPLTFEQHREFALKMADQLLNALFAKETHPGVHSTLVKILREDAWAYQWMGQATRGTAWKLIQAKSPAAQELGGILIEFKINTEALFADRFDFNELVELSNHEVLAVRQASWIMFSKMLHHLQKAMNPTHHLEEMAKAAKLLESSWDDSRKFWFEMFEIHFTAEDFTPGILVSICDSVRAETQAFGRKLITRFFADEDGQEYLLKLSEHPSAALQTFATNYLERYAADNPERLYGLKHYFISVLSRVNKARIAKARVMAFLTAEAQKSEAAARLAAEIFARQSVTMAIGDRAAAIEAMLEIQQRFPQISLPLQVISPEVRHAF
jgi:predicted DNA-binding WGR domain protein